MTGLALILFVGLFAFGGQAFGWRDHDNQIQIALFLSFLFGIACGYRPKG